MNLNRVSIVLIHRMNASGVPHRQSVCLAKQFKYIFLSGNVSTTLQKEVNVSFAPIYIVCHSNFPTLMLMFSQAHVPINIRTAQHVFETKNVAGVQGTL